MKMTHKPLTRTASSLVALCLLSGVLLLPAQLATAAAPDATCLGAGCNGLDPITTGCDRDAVTKQGTYTRELKVEIRYSKRCSATWSRVTNLVRRSRPITEAYVSVGDITFVSRRAAVVWSKMATGVLEACGRVTLNEVDEPYPLCTVYDVRLDG